MNQICFIDGRIVRGEEACIPVDDLALQRGYAVFDFARTYHGKLFHFRDHLARLRRSAAALHLVLPYSNDELVATAATLVDRLGEREAGIRMILTGGSAHAANLLEHPRLVMIAEELPRLPAGVYEGGVKLITYEFERDLPYVKTTNYMTGFRLIPVRVEKGAFEVLYTWRGLVLECTRDNFFVFRGDVLVTPKNYVLQGITRQVILSLASPHFRAEERDVQIEELDSVDEAFLSSTSKQIVPVVQIDERRIGLGTVGERTRKIMRLFDSYAEKYQP